MSKFLSQILILPKKVLVKTQNQPIDIWFFFLFLLTWSLTIRKVAWYFPVKGEFNEYTGIYVYISDIFLFLTILVWIAFKLYNLFYNSSSLIGYRMWITSVIPRVIHKICSTLTPWKQNVPRETFFFSTGWNIFIPFLIVFFSFISITWSQNQTIALFRSIKLLEYFILYIYIVYRFIPQMFHSVKSENVPRETNYTPGCSTPAPLSDVASDFTRWNILISTVLFAAIVNAIVAITQFITQHSIGLRFLKESILSSDIPGVAKVVINNIEYIRAYGLFPHPNILGGFLLFSIMLTLAYKNRPTPAPLSDVASDFTGWNTNPKLSLIRREASSEAKIVSRETFSLSENSNFHFLTKKWFIPALLGIQFLALGLTFSKSAILGLALSLIYIYVPRGTFSGNISKLFHVEQFKEKKKMVLLTLIMLTFIYLINIDPDYFINQSITERLKYLNVSRGTILDNPILGAGAGQFILEMNDQTGRRLESWQLQPVHNVFLLIWSEVGIVGFVLFGLLIFRMFHPSKNQDVPLLPREKQLFHVEQLFILQGETFTENALSTYHFLSKKLKRGLCKGIVLPVYALFKPLSNKNTSVQPIDIYNNVPRGTLTSSAISFLSKRDSAEMFHPIKSDVTSDNGASVEHSDPININKNTLRDIKDTTEQEKENSILSNNNILLSSGICLSYLKAILLGFTFIMLFDHYFWDIQQGSIMLWIILGLIAAREEN